MRIKITKEDIIINRVKHPPLVAWYNEYLQSPAWRAKREKLFKKRGGKQCERCGTNVDIVVHHKTYERVGNERLTDLEILCKTCHIIRHQMELIPFSYRIYE